MKHIIENPDLEYIVDTSNKLSINDLISLPEEKFKTNKGVLNLGLNQNTIWIKLYVKNNNSEYKKWTCTVFFPLIDSVTLYDVSSNQKYTEKLLGEMLPNSERVYENKNIVFPFSTNYNETNLLYLKVRTEGAIYMPISISSEEYMFNAEKKSNFYYGLFYGASVLILIYNVLLFFTLRDNIYLLYCLYIVVIISILSYFNGFISYLPIFENNRFLLNKLFANIVFGFIIISSLFSYFFLDLKKAEKSIRFIVLGIVFSGILFTVLSFFIEYRIIIKMASIFYIITPFTLLVISIIKWFQGNETARFYTIASTFFMVSLFMMSFRVLGFIKGNKFQEMLIEIGVILDAILISLALADKLRKFRKDKDLAQEVEMIAITQKEMLISEQNNVLENKVKARTQEIIEKNEKLEEYSNTIRQQNDLLLEYNENLEKQILERTKEIVETNKQLERKTDRLEQFTYIVSHNLKSPVNNIDSLLGFVNYSELNDENKEYLEVIKKTNKQLKNIIDEINILVKLDKTTDLEYTEISLKDLVVNIKEKLVIQIENSQCNIISKFGIENIRSFAPYLNSIIFNLVSNSIKYRSRERRLEIILESAEINDNYVIKVRDNGMGISPNQIDNIFKLFYRLNMEEEGKGMGLFIVKSQIEAIGGNIKVQSTLDIGTEFTISLPK